MIDTICEDTTFYYSVRVQDMCKRKYYNHPKGCPNVGKLYHPPNVPLFDEVFDLNKSTYIVGLRFDLKEHFDSMRKGNPKWTDRQVYCVLYWQGRTRKLVKEFALSKFNNIGIDVIFDRVPSRYGVNMNKTIKPFNKSIHFPVVRYTWTMGLVATPNDLFKTSDMFTIPLKNNKNKKLSQFQ